MGTSNEKEQKPKPTNPPEQKLGDTPVPPWEMPTPEEKEQAKPIRRALKDAVANVDSPEKADEVIEKLETSVADQTMKDVEQAQPPPASPASAARQVEKAAQTAPDGKKDGKGAQDDRSCTGVCRQASAGSGLRGGAGDPQPSTAGRTSDRGE